MKQTIIYGQEAREAVLKGIDMVADAVKTTLGARGRNVIVSSSSLMEPYSTKDGVTVARSIKTGMTLEKVGADTIKQVSIKTASQAGDGTTTAMVLGQAIAHEGMKAVADGANPVQLKREIDTAVSNCVAHLKAIATPVEAEDKAALMQIATISANGDTEIGNFVSEAFHKVGKHGVVLMNESNKVASNLELVSGYKHDSGWLSPLFVNEHQRGLCILEMPLILVLNKKLPILEKEFMPLMEAIEQTKRPLVIIAEDVSGTALTQFGGAMQKGIMKCLCVGIPYVADRKNDALEDIAAICGAKVVSDAGVIKLSDIAVGNYTIDQFLGEAEKIVASRTETTIVGGAADVDKVNSICSQIEASLETEWNEAVKEQKETRMGKLRGKFAVYNIGGSTPVEIAEKRDRVDDAIRATKSALEEGFVAGAGSIFYHYAKNMEVVTGGDALLKKVLVAPYNTICKNAGIEPQELNEGMGLNVITGNQEALIETGVIDPVKVLRCSLENAASVGSLLITTEAVVYEYE